MEDIQKLKEDRTFELRTAEAILKKAEAENREVNEAEKVEIAEHRNNAEVLRQRIKAAEDHEKLRAELGNELSALNAPVQARATAPIAIEKGAQAGRIEFPLARYGALRAFPATREGEERAYRSGMALMAGLFGAGYAKRFCRDYGIEVRVQTEGVNTAGGILVPDEMASTIIDLREQFGVFRRNVRVEPMSSDTKTVPRRTSGLTAYFAAEGAAATESDAAWDSIGLVAKKLGTRTRYSNELGEDAVIDFADTLAREAAYALAYKEDQVGFTGTGIATDGSIVGVVTKFNNNTSLAGAVAAASGHDTFAEIDVADLAKLMAALPEYAAANAKFYCSRVAAEIIFGRLQASAGGNTTQTLAGALQRSYLGYPIEVTQVMTKVQTALNATCMVLFGDLSMAAIMGNRRDITIGLSDQRYWEEDQIGIKVSERIDINVHSVGSTTAGDTGPIVALMGTT